MPIVALRVGGVAEIIGDGVHGFLVEPGDVESLAQTLARVLGDDELDAKMTSAVENLADGELSWDDIAKQTARLYQVILSYQSVGG